MKRLIINADDFGLLPEVSRAIVDSYLAGSLTSTTLMANMPAAADAVQQASRAPGLAVGLHLTLTCGRPVSDPGAVPTLVDQAGRFLRRTELLRGCMTGRVRQADLRREIAAQFARFDQLGLPLSHVDSHQHVHLFPPVFRALAPVVEERAVPLRLPGVVDLKGRRQSGGQWLKKAVLQTFIAWDRRYLQRTPTNDHFLSIWDVVPFPDPIRLEHYEGLLRQVGAGLTELMVHPAYVSDELTQYVDIAPISAQETPILLQHALLTRAQSLGFEPTTYQAAGGRP